MILINSHCNLPIDKIIETCKIAYSNLESARLEKVSVWLDKQRHRHQSTWHKKWFKSSYVEPTDAELVKQASDLDRELLTIAQNCHREDGIIISTIHEAAKFAKQLGAETMQVDANSLKIYGILFLIFSLCGRSPH